MRGLVRVLGKFFEVLASALALPYSATPQSSGAALSAAVLTIRFFGSQNFWRGVFDICLHLKRVREGSAWFGR